MNARYRVTSDLPETIPVFPLTGVLLLPRGQLPLNVFEPRYLAMVDAVMSGARIIGIIQPSESEEKALKPALSSVGCAGRVTSYREAEDGRYLIILSGLCRFRVAEERELETPFRQVRADYAPFAGDLAATEEDGDFPRERMNPNGGSVALGHPFAATGARILSQAVKELAALPQGSRAIVSICSDGGLGTVALLER